MFNITMSKELDITREHWEWLGETLSRHSNAKVAPTVISLLVSRVKLFELGSKETIITEGDIGREMYVIYKGSVSITLKKKKITELKEGDFFGEISITTKAPRTATVQAKKSCQVFELSWDALAVLDEHFHEMMLVIQRVSSQRMEDLARRGIK
ncbi:cyclic nucleotide-binding domain-containing protein [Elusimicrobiota bacterium]